MRSAKRYREDLVYLICDCGNWDLDLDFKNGQVVCPKCGKTGPADEFKETEKEEQKNDE